MDFLELNTTNHELNIPNKAIFNDVAHKRGLITKDKELYAFKKYEAGIEGEAILRSYVSEYGEKNWILLQNVWLDYYGIFECDFLLFTAACCYVFEVKNYAGRFSYEDGECVLNSKRLSSNCIQQARRSAINIESICSELSSTIEVQGVLAFVGVDNHVKICSNVGELRVIQRTQLRDFIRKIAQRERNKRGPSVNFKRTIKHLEQYQVRNPFMPEPITEEKMLKVRKGIYCNKCASYSILIKKQRVICKSCNFVESRKTAVLRAICDYGILNYEMALKTGKLLEFLDGQVGRNYLIEILRGNFDRKANYRSTYYKNNSYDILNKIQSEEENK